MIIVAAALIGKALPTASDATHLARLEARVAAHESRLAALEAASPSAASVNSKVEDAETCSARWLRTAQDGFCETSDGGGDCAVGDRGSWALSAAEASSWEAAAAACTAHCTACPRCKFASASLVHRDCTWTHSEQGCELQTFVHGFKTAAGCQVLEEGSSPANAAALPIGTILDHRASASSAGSRTPDRKQPLEAPSERPLWLAIGVIVAPNVYIKPPAGSSSNSSGSSSSSVSSSSVGSRFHHQSFASLLNGTVAWQYVTSDARYHADPRFLVVRCRDGPFAGLSDDDAATALASACACKTILWFRKALDLFPRARFLAKLEDDAAVHDARLLTELRHAHTRFGPQALLWYGMFQWAGLHPASRRNGWFCGEGDDLLGVPEPNCPQPRPPTGRRRLAPGGAADDGAATGGAADGAEGRAASEGGAVVGPFASGGMDVRSRRFAEVLSRCAFAHEYAHEWTALKLHGGCEDYRLESCGVSDWAGACDSIQGYLLVRCMREQRWATSEPSGEPRSSDVTLLHLTGGKFHAPPTRAQTTVVHGGTLKGGDASAAERDAWRWHLGAAMLPLEFTLSLSERGARWCPLNRSAVAAFERARRSAGRACHAGTVPCNSVAEDEELRLNRLRRQRR